MQPRRHKHHQPQTLPADPATPIVAERMEAEEPLKCVWSGFPNYDRSCRSRIPTSVVVKAWHREMQLKGNEDGFFYFSWRSGVWLAYGLADGGVRGVYCPTHCSERDARETPCEVTPSERPSEQEDPSERPSERAGPAERRVGIALQ